MVEFADQDLSAARFTRTRLAGASFHNLTLRDATFDWVDMSNVRVRGALVDGAEINGDFGRLTINGVDVGPLIEAELDRRHPGRAVVTRPSDAAGFRQGWVVLRRLWDDTVQRARQSPSDLLHESVDGQWTFIETLRHLVFVVEAWVHRAVLGEASPWHPLSLPFDEMAETQGLPRNRAVQPSLDEVLAVLNDRHTTVERLLTELTDERLDEMTEPVTEPGWPEPRSFSVRDCLNVMLSEQFEHRVFAERDLTVLEQRTPRAHGQYGSAL